MADFFQNGCINTFQILRERPVEEIEKELRFFSESRKIALLLPSLYSEFEGPALPRILEELKDVDYIDKIVLSLDNADERQFNAVKKAMSSLKSNVKIIWHDGPRIKKIADEFRKAGFWLDMPGKGRSVWLALGYLFSDSGIYAIGLHDCDIVNYKRILPARLFYPVVHPALDYEFSKGYYARLNHRLYGRVTRLFYTPLIRSLKKILGCNTFLEYLDSFRYALSGEFAFISSLAKGVRISPTWGLEVSMLSEVYYKTAVNRISQVELMENYEHKHQIIDRTRPDEGLVRMARDIAKTLFKVMTQDGVVMSASFLRTVMTSYIQESRFAVEKYNALSMINCLDYNRNLELEAVESFVLALKMAIYDFIEDPVNVPMLAAWNRIQAAMPDIPEKLREAVELDNDALNFKKSFPGHSARLTESEVISPH